MSFDPAGLVNQPQQERSRQTMIQILDAAALILESKTFEELSIAEVVQQAGTSVGAFYGRFRDKDALLLALEERFFAEFEREFTVILSRPGWVEKPFPSIIRDIVEFMVAVYSKHQGILRALHLKARMHSSGPFKEREQRFWIKLFPLFQSVLLEHQVAISHPNPERAAQFGFQQLFFTVHEIFLWGPLREGRPYGVDEQSELCEELTRAFLAYLELKEG